MNEDKLLQTIEDVVGEFGTPVYLRRGQVGENSRTTATFEVLVNVVSDAEATTLAMDLRGKIASLIEELKVEGFSRTVNDEAQKLTLVTQSPKLTYRDPATVEVPNGILYSVSIGFPFVLDN